MKRARGGHAGSAGACGAPCGCSGGRFLEKLLYSRDWISVVCPRSRVALTFCTVFVLAQEGLQGCRKVEELGQQKPGRDKNVAFFPWRLVALSPWHVRAPWVPSGKTRASCVLQSGFGGRPGEAGYPQQAEGEVAPNDKAKVQAVAVLH